MSQLGSMDSVSKLQKQKKGPWSLGKRTQKYTFQETRRGKADIIWTVDSRAVSTLGPSP